MNNKEFIDNIAQKTGCGKELVTHLLDSFISIVAESVLGGNSISVQGFGTFELKEKSERKIYNPSSKSFKTVPSKKVVNYKMSSVLKDKINNI